MDQTRVATQERATKRATREKTAPTRTRIRENRELREKNVPVIARAIKTDLSRRGRSFKKQNGKQRQKRRLPAVHKTSIATKRRSLLPCHLKSGSIIG